MMRIPKEPNFPEVIEQAYVSVKADVYSFGVMLWEMLFGEVPYDGMDLEEVCGSICRGDHPVCRPDFQVRLPGICRLMERCWELCPSARPDCGQLMAELAKIRDVIDLRSVPSPPPLPPPPLPHARLPQPEELSGNRRSSVAAAGFNVTKEDLEAQRSRLRRTEDTLPPDDEHEPDIEAASSRLLSHIMKRAIRERRTDSGWGQQVRNRNSEVENILNLDIHRIRAMPGILKTATASHLGPSRRTAMKTHLLASHESILLD